MQSPVLVPEWPLPAGVQAACSTRAGGVSAPPYDSLNLGDHVGDAPAAVADNRQRWAQRADLALVLSEEPAAGTEDLPL